ncbi:hypothetical protein NPIL_632371 [Nephila pilipes]|uniref:Uncharacterized protein n=1 Tax=Nephila pilipes TaxID=299642 RepID=A0A8X6QQD8_NEPPI|nr:hypothetical protein NPIL_632371 [Nephila pilipes]
MKAKRQLDCMTADHSCLALLLFQAGDDGVCRVSKHYARADGWATTAETLAGGFIRTRRRTKYLLRQLVYYVGRRHDSIRPLPASCPKIFVSTL